VEATTQGQQKVTLGTQRRDEDSRDQARGVHGAALLLAPAASYTISFTPDLYTWDSYNAPGDYSGYWDSFSVSVSDLPYWQRTDLIEDPLSLPFIWGGNDYGNGSEEPHTTPGTITVASPDPSKVQYLSVVLDTNTQNEADELYPSYGTFVLTTNPLPVPPVVRVATTLDRSQAAEGATTNDANGQFTFYRDGGDISLPLTVTYSVATGAGKASSNDFASIGTSVTFAPNQRSATVDVVASPDTEVEATEAVTLTLNDPGPNGKYKLAQADKQSATVNILDRKKYFVYFYGTHGPNLFGDTWLDKLRDIQASRGYVTFGEFIDNTQYNGFRENRGSRAVHRLLDHLNADGGNVISAAEAESADVTVAGWSLGASTAVNFTYDLQRVGPWVADYKLRAEVPVKALVTWDPNVDLRVGDALIKPLHRLESVEDNVKKFRNYYQQRASWSFFQTLDAAGQVSGLSGPIQTPFIIGNAVTSHVPPDLVEPQQVQVDVDDRNTPEVRDRTSSAYAAHRESVGDSDPLFNGLPNEPRWRLYGDASPRVGVNHSTLTWYAWRRSKDDLG
jgi:hypothetical protein